MIREHRTHCEQIVICEPIILFNIINYGYLTECHHHTVTQYSVQRSLAFMNGRIITLFYICHLGPGSVPGARGAECRPQRSQARLDPGRSHSLFAEHLGRDAVPAHLVGGRAGRHHRVAADHRHIGGGVRDHDAVAVGDMHQWRGEGRRYLLHNFAFARP